MRAADWSELCGSSRRNLCFCLDSAAFSTPSCYHTAAQYQRLKRHLFSKFECRQAWVELEASPIHAVNLDTAARRRACIPETAAFFCFCYPMDSETKMKRGLDSQR